MNWRVLSVEQVIALHDRVLNPGELPGLALDKSIEGALARVENRIAYGMIGDVFDLAAATAAAISQGHCFNDANKRTAFRALQMTLAMNGQGLPLEPDATIGDLIIRLAQRQIDDGHLADWLRERCP
jgi:death on curing protein